jgi:acetylornithine deacetylase/succinyl-diaminopimelate desuccinylase-like protein
MLFSHLDVVAAEPEHWVAPPFAAQVRDGYLVGRGALDMKQMSAMSLMALLAAKRSGRRLARDLIFAAVADEEAGGRYGAAYLVEHHPDLIRAGFALCEIGGFRIDIKGRIYYPVQVAERGCAWCRVSYQGEPGHGSVPNPDSALLRMTRSLSRLGGRHLPLHVTPTMRRFVECVAARQRPDVQLVMRGLLHPATHRISLALMEPEQARLMAAQLHNTAVPTVVRAGDKQNVIPSTAEVRIDGRVLPGQRWEEFRHELQEALGPHAQIELTQWLEPLVYSSDTPLFETIRQILEAREPGATVVPYLLTGFTDAKHLDKLGTVTYGFSPMFNDPQEKFAKLAHGHNERIEVSAFCWGVDVLTEVVERFCSSADH